MKIDEIVIFSPLPPSKTGIADYIVEIGREIERFVKVIYVISDDVKPTTYSPLNGEIIRESEFVKEKRLHELPLIYHMGNNVQHEYIFHALQKTPGIVVMHDYSMHHLFVELTLARGDKEAYKRLMIENYGDFGAEVAQNREQGVFNGMFQFLLPLNKTILELAKGTVVHSYDSYYKVKNLFPEMLVGKISFPFRVQESVKLFPTRDAARKSLGLDRETLILASFGFVTPPKQIQYILKSLCELKNSMDDFEYWIIGEDTGSIPLQQLICEYDLEKHVKVYGYVSFDDLHIYMQACDIALSLRYPSAGETSAALYRTMGIGVCCVVFDYASYADVDDDAVIKIQLDTSNTRELVGTLLNLSQNKQEIRRIATNARDLVNRDHAASRSAKEFLGFVRRVYCHQEVLT